MPLLGAHLSIAGGFHRAVEAAAELGVDTVQVFTHSPSQWSVKRVAADGAKSSARSATGSWESRPIAAAEAKRFRTALTEHHIRQPLSHASYLINLAAPADELWERSVAAFVVELHRAELLGIPYVVVHPGAFTTSHEDAGLDRVAQALDTVRQQTGRLACRCLLENTAGQGTTLGWRFEQLAEIIRRADCGDELGVCLDTCHAFAAGYPLIERADYDATMDELDRVVGLDRVRAFHLNDSKREFGSRIDRHEHIGRGALGLKPFAHLLNDPRFQTLPMCLETDKGTENGENLDAINLRTLRGLIR